ncbi:tRNA-Val4 [Priestia endophytica]|uniref:tRNA-Val4 n=1 Tax=Priestia endophytica TaxID=135735 RepID=UPI000DCA81CD|nr:tRNA-Val4 [Priestia endophytica]RAS72836.1 tRNA-Val4 [Priestia endophytica]
MNYSYSFYRDHLNMLRIKLPENIELFSDFVEDISTEDEVDEYITYVDNVMKEVYENYEIQLNITSVSINKESTIVKDLFPIEENHTNTIETEQFRQLLLIWKNKIPERFQE